MPSFGHSTCHKIGWASSNLHVYTPPVPSLQLSGSMPSFGHSTCHKIGWASSNLDVYTPPVPSLQLSG
eukprot:scaffold119_cov245-Chaetoceros_neogracile.AAC.13